MLAEGLILLRSGADIPVKVRSDTYVPSRDAVAFRWFPTYCAETAVRLDIRLGNGHSGILESRIFPKRSSAMDIFIPGKGLYRAIAVSAASCCLYLSSCGSRYSGEMLVYLFQAFEYDRPASIFQSVPKEFS